MTFTCTIALYESVTFVEKYLISTWLYRVYIRFLIRRVGRTLIVLAEDTTRPDHTTHGLHPSLLAEMGSVMIL